MSPPDRRDRGHDSRLEKRPPSGKRADENRRAILAGARQAFLVEGFDVSMDTVAAGANVSKVTIYNHFASKEDLFVAVIGTELDRALHDALALVETHLAESNDLRRDLIDACRAWVAGVAAPDMIALRNVVAGAIGRFPELGETWHQRGPQRFHPVVAAALRRLVKRRLLTIPHIDLAVLQLSGLVLSPNLVYGAHGSPLSGKLTDRLVVAGVDMFLDHYHYRPPARGDAHKTKSSREATARSHARR